MGLRLGNHSRHVETAAYASARAQKGPNKIDLFFKRLFDIAVSLALIILTGPLMLVMALAIKLQDGGNAVFAQTRYGLDGKAFRCFKLRSMVPDAQAQLEAYLEANPLARSEWAATQKLTNDPRITALGNFLRKSSIDELPQLFNILKGDMSLVGPRPIVEDEISRYGDHFKHYCSVRPGLTGLWQVRGRSNTSYTERVAMDVEYARTRTLPHDILIMFQTIPAVLASKGAR